MFHESGRLNTAMGDLTSFSSPLIIGCGKKLHQFYCPLLEDSITLISIAHLFDMKAKDWIRNYADPSQVPQNTPTCSENQTRKNFTMSELVKVYEAKNSTI